MIRRPPRSTLFPYTRSSDLPRETPRDVEAIYAGIRAACDPAGVAVVGGDTSASRTDLFLAVMVLGDAAPGAVLRRSGARAGDRLYVTGTLGGAKAGFEILQARNPAK